MINNYGTENAKKNHKWLKNKKTFSKKNKNGNKDLNILTYE